MFAVFIAKHPLELILKSVDGMNKSCMQGIESTDALFHRLGLGCLIKLKAMMNSCVYIPVPGLSKTTLYAININLGQSYFLVYLAFFLAFVPLLLSVKFLQDFLHLYIRKNSVSGKFYFGFAYLKRQQ